MIPHPSAVSILVSWGGALTEGLVSGLAGKADLVMRPILPALTLEPTSKNERAPSVDVQIWRRPESMRGTMSCSAIGEPLRASGNPLSLELAVLESIGRVLHTHSFGVQVGSASQCDLQGGGVGALATSRYQWRRIAALPQWLFLNLCGQYRPTACLIVHRLSLREARIPREGF